MKPFKRFLFSKKGKTSTPASRTMRQGETVKVAKVANLLHHNLACNLILTKCILLFCLVLLALQQLHLVGRARDRHISHTRAVWP